MTNIFIFIFCSKEQHSLTTTSIPGVNKVVSWHSFIVSCIQFVGENLNRRAISGRFRAMFSAGAGEASQLSRACYLSASPTPASKFGWLWWKWYEYDWWTPAHANSREGGGPPRNRCALIRTPLRAAPRCCHRPGGRGADRGRHPAPPAGRPAPAEYARSRSQVSPEQRGGGDLPTIIKFCILFSCVY